MNIHPRPLPPTRLLPIAMLALSWFGLPSPTLAADAPNTCVNAPLSSRNVWLSESIGTASDVDWFRFSVAAGTRALLTLGNLPADYDLRLYSGCSALLESSTRPGRQFDEIYRHLPAGTYGVKVSGFEGAHSTSSYRLRLRTLAWGTPVLSTSSWTDGGGYLHVVGEVLNNTAEPRGWLEVDASLLGSTGSVLGSAVAYTKVPVLRPWSRSPFEIVTRNPAGFARFTLRVCTPNGSGGCTSGQVATAPQASVAANASPTYLDGAGRRHYPGTIRNDGTSTVHLARAVVTLYGVDGAVRGLGVDLAAPSTIGAAKTGAYDAVGSTATLTNRVSTTAVGATPGCASGPRYTGAQENLLPPLTRASANGRVALTFDMGGRMTPAVRILNTLVANGVCSTIFPTGAISRTAEGQAALAVIKAHPELFELGNHTMHHCDLVRGGGGSPGAADAAFCEALGPSPSETEVKAELIDGDAWIRTYAGMPTAPLWRAPYGVSNLAVRTWAAEAGWTKHVDWDIDTVDWKPIADGGPTATSMTLKVVNGARSGSIVLMHLGGFQTPDALQSMIDGLRSRGFTLTTVSDLAQ